MRKQKQTGKVYTKIVLNMNTNEVIEEESFNYDGRWAMCDGEGEGEGEGEGGGESWQDTLPQDVREWDEVKNSDSPEKFWNQMVNMRSHIGQSIRVPSADAGEEDRKAFQTKLMEKVPSLMTTPNFEDEATMGDLYTRMGRPNEAKEYKVPEFKNSRDEVVKNINPDIIESFKENAFKAGLTQKQFAEAVKAFVAPGITKQEQIASDLQNSQKELATEWGVAHERNTKTVENFLKVTDAPENLVKAIESGAVGKDSMLWIHKLATQSVKGDSSFQQDANNRTVMTPDEAAMKISEIRNNKQHPYNKKQDPGHKAAMAYMRELYLIKNPESGKGSAPGTNFSVGGGL